MSEDMIPWRKLFHRPCPAVFSDGNEVVHCDLRRGHEKAGWLHRAERGMYDLVWSNSIATTDSESEPTGPSRVPPCDMLPDELIGKVECYDVLPNARPERRPRR